MKTQVGAKTYIPALLASMMLLAGSAAQATQSASEQAAVQLLAHAQVSYPPVGNAAFFDAHAAAGRLLTGETPAAQRTEVSEAASVSVSSPRHDVQATAVRLLSGGTTAAPSGEARVSTPGKTMKQPSETATGGALVHATAVEDSLR
jgi:hypothetical protein